MPRTIEQVADMLIDLYNVGPIKCTRPLRILRKTIRSYRKTSVIRKPALVQLDKTLRKSGYLLYPLDKDNYSTAKEWIVEDIQHLYRVRLPSEANLRRAFKPSRGPKDLW